MHIFFFERVYFIEYFFFLGFFCLSAFFLVSANEFIFFYLSIELQALILYTLASLKRYNSFSAESSLKYFVLGALSSGILLFGISFFYGFTGLTNFYDVRFLMISLFGDSIFPGISLAVGFILSAFLFKLASAPFHLWLPDVYDGAPTPIVLFFAILPKLAVILFLVKFYFTILVDCVELWHTALFVSGLLSVLWGTFGALNQLNIKRLYAYSAIVNMGYLVVSFSYGTVENFVNTINYLIPYIISSIAIFTLILLFRKGSTFRKIKFIGDYKYYFNYSIVLACTVTLIFFSLAGVPPLAGFFTKFFLFRTIFLLDFLTNCVIFIIIVVSVITAFYYIRVVRFVFFYNIRSPLLFLPILFSGALLLIIAVAVLLLFVLIQPLALTTILLSLTSIVL